LKKGGFMALNWQELIEFSPLVIGGVLWLLGH